MGRLGRGTGSIFLCPSAAGTTLKEQAEPADQDVAVRHPALCFLHQGRAHTTPGLPVPEGFTDIGGAKDFWTGLSRVD